MTHPQARNATHLRLNTTPFICALWRTGFALCLLALNQATAFAEDEVATYKKLSLQELMDLEVTSVSRRPEKLSDTASAIAGKL